MSVEAESRDHAVNEAHLMQDGADQDGHDHIVYVYEVSHELNHSSQRLRWLPFSDEG